MWHQVVAFFRSASTRASWNHAVCAETFAVVEHVCRGEKQLRGVALGVAINQEDFVVFCEEGA